MPDRVANTTDGSTPPNYRWLWWFLFALFAPLLGVFVAAIVWGAYMHHVPEPERPEYISSKSNEQAAKQREMYETHYRWKETGWWSGYGTVCGVLVLGLVSAWRFACLVSKDNSCFSALGVMLLVVEYLVVGYTMFIAVLFRHG